MTTTRRNVQSYAHCDGPGCPTVEVQVGDVVIDGLTYSPESGVSKATVLEIWEGQSGPFTTIGIKLDSDYLGGLRHPWEISTLAALER